MFFRIMPKATIWPKYYEVQVMGSTMRSTIGYSHTGDLLGFAKVPENAIQDDQWFHLHLIASGSHIRVNIDGKCVLDYIDPQRSFTHGPIGLQKQHPSTRVSYRNIRVKKY